MKLKAPNLVFIAGTFLFAWASISAQSDFKKDSISLERSWNASESSANESITLHEKQLREGIEKAQGFYPEYPEQYYFRSRQADMLSRLAFVSIQNGDLSQSMEHLVTSVKMKQEIKRVDDSGHAYYLMGIIWTRMDEYEKAKKSYDTAYAITQRNLMIGKPKHSFKRSIESMISSLQQFPF